MISNQIEFKFITVEQRFNAHRTDNTKRESSNEFKCLLIWNHKRSRCKGILSKIDSKIQRIYFTVLILEDENETKQYRQIRMYLAAQQTNRLIYKTGSNISPILDMMIQWMPRKYQSFLDFKSMFVIFLSTTKSKTSNMVCFLLAKKKY